MSAEHPDPILVYGAGGFAREVAWLAEECGHQVAAFVDDAQVDGPRVLNGLPVVDFGVARSLRSRGFVVGIGNPASRAAVTERSILASLQPVTLVHPRVERSRWIDIGEGTVICAGNILTTNIRLGKGVQINLDCTIGHDVVMEDFATLAPGVHVSGWVRLERCCYIGTGATIINGTSQRPLVIGAGAIVGAGACVTKSIRAGVTAVGVPAKSISREA